MSYRINHFNGSLIAVINDGTVDNTLDITLVGKNYAGYGAIQNDNFVYLLENFANVTAPSKPLAGQVWFDSGNRKLKFFDGSQFRAAGGAETGTSEPSGLTIGDFWWDSVNNQLHAYTGSGFALIGPQVVATAGATEMLATTVRDTDGFSHPITKALSNGETVFTISADPDYLLDTGLNDIPGFTWIRQGLTLPYTYDPANVGVTQTGHRFYGTSTNAERLGGKLADTFVQAGDANFSTVVNFADVGFTIGNPTPKLKIFNSGDLYPTVANIWNEQINFTTTVGSITKQTIQLNGTDVLAGTPGVSNLGSSGASFNAVYAANFHGIADNAGKLIIDNSAIDTTSYRSAKTTATANTIVARDSDASITANMFNGTALKAEYADLAEMYLADQPYEVGTVMKVGGVNEVTAAGFGSNAIGVVSEKPAYLMNKDLVNGTPIALKGRVPVKVIGSVTKGDMLIAVGNGYGRADNEGAGYRQFGIALESNDADDVKLVECLIL